MVKPQVQKICGTCKQSFPATSEYFTTHPTCSFGLSNKCKSCTSEYMKRRRAIKSKEIDKKNLPYARAYKERNKEKELLRTQEWRDNNPDAIKEYSKKYYHEHREEIMEKVVAWGNKNPEKKRRYRLKTVFGISTEEYEARLSSQKGVCAICGLPEMTKDKNGAIRPLSIDHDHTSNKIRGLLCAKCNIGLGQFNDNYDILLSAANYLMGGGV